MHVAHKAILISTLVLLPFGYRCAHGEDTFLGRSADQWTATLTSSEGQQREHAAWAVAQLAARSAGGPSDQVHFAELVKLISDGDATVRYWSVQGLESFARKLGAKGAAQTAIANTLEPLLADKSPAPRIAAAGALGALGKVDKALPVLVDAMGDPQEAVRIQAVALLERL